MSNPVNNNAAPADGEEFELKSLIDPITLETMKDPVTLDGRFTFDRASIQACFDRGNFINPLTNLPFSSRELVPSVALKAVIDELKPEQLIQLTAFQAAVKKQKEAVQKQQEETKQLQAALQAQREAAAKEAAALQAQLEQNAKIAADLKVQREAAARDAAALRAQLEENAGAAALAAAELKARQEAQKKAEEQEKTRQQHETQLRAKQAEERKQDAEVNQQLGADPLKIGNAYYNAVVSFSSIFDDGSAVAARSVMEKAISYCNSAEKYLNFAQRLRSNKGKGPSKRIEDYLNYCRNSKEKFTSKLSAKPSSSFNYTSLSDAIDQGILPYFFIGCDLSEVPQERVAAIRFYQIALYLCEQSTNLTKTPAKRQRLAKAREGVENNLRHLNPTNSEIAEAINYAQELYSPKPAPSLQNASSSSSSSSFNPSSSSSSSFRPSSSSSFSASLSSASSFSSSLHEAQNPFLKHDAMLGQLDLDYDPFSSSSSSSSSNSCFSSSSSAGMAYPGFFPNKRKASTSLSSSASSSQQEEDEDSYQAKRPKKPAKPELDHDFFPSFDSSSFASGSSSDPFQSSTFEEPSAPWENNTDIPQTNPLKHS